FTRVSPRRPVTVNLLDPFKVNHRHNADLEIDMLSNVDLLCNNGAVQPLVKQQIGIFGQVRPLREGTRCGAIKITLLGVVYVMSRTRLSALAVASERLRQLFQQIRFGTKMAEMGVALG